VSCCCPPFGSRPLVECHHSTDSPQLSYIGAKARGSEKESFPLEACHLPCSSMSPQSRSRAAFASGLFSEPAAGRLPLALRRLVCRHILNPIFVRLRFLRLCTDRECGLDSLPELLFLETYLGANVVLGDFLILLLSALTCASLGWAVLYLPPSYFIARKRAPARPGALCLFTCST
jgi:hypothetical protein